MIWWGWYAFVVRRSSRGDRGALNICTYVYQGWGQGTGEPGRQCCILLLELIRSLLLGVFSFITNYVLFLDICTSILLVAYTSTTVCSIYIIVLVVVLLLVLFTTCTVPATTMVQRRGVLWWSSSCPLVTLDCATHTTLLLI